MYEMVAFVFFPILSLFRAIYGSQNMVVAYKPVCVFDYGAHVNK